jgi:protein-S-isoprenylcysteine O-methyltransferase Ste14
VEAEADIGSRDRRAFVSGLVVFVACVDLRVRWLELKIPPLGAAAVAAGMMWLTAWATPSLSVPIRHRAMVAACVVLLGTALAIAAIVGFRRANTSVHPMKLELTSALVTDGIYGVSRNPMYLGIVIALLGWCIYLANLVAPAFVVAFVVYMNRFQILPEETRLERQFGQRYKNYKRTVRRWL